MDTGVRHKVGLELGDINVEGTIETEGGSQGGDDLCDESVKVGVSGSLDIKVATADIIDCLIVKHNSHISMFEEGVRREDRVVGLNNCSRDLRGGVDGETKLRLLSIVD